MQNEIDDRIARLTDLLRLEKAVIRNAEFAALPFEHQRDREMDEIAVDVHVGQVLALHDHRRAQHLLHRLMEEPRDRRSMCCIASLYQWLPQIRCRCQGCLSAPQSRPDWPSNCRSWKECR